MANSEKKVDEIVDYGNAYLYKGLTVEDEQPNIVSIKNVKRQLNFMDALKNRQKHESRKRIETR